MNRLHSIVHQHSPSYMIMSLLLIIIISLSGCHDSRNNTNKKSPAPAPATEDIPEIAHPRFSSDFESGSIGTVSALNSTAREWKITIKDDNNNANLPKNYRVWWYFRADDVPTKREMQLEFSGLGFPYFFIPIYSYDQKNWQYFKENEVVLKPGCTTLTQKGCSLIVSKHFTSSTVWIARTFPYTTADLSAFLKTIAHNPHVRIRTLGTSPNKQAIQLITISDHLDNHHRDATTSGKKIIWINARTHSAETGPSFLLEGLIRTVLADDSVGKNLRHHYIFNIVPMHNIDGVKAGNYRTNTASINLEHLWFFDKKSSPYLNKRAPMEDKLLNAKAMVPILRDKKNPVVLALNLHSSNSTADTAAFFFPHFGSDANKYNQAQQALWLKQNAFIKSVASHYNGKIERPPSDGGAGFTNSGFPESWWWAHKGSAVNAITMETTYGRAGFDHWVTADDLRALGAAVAKAINDLGNTSKVFAKDDVSMFSLPFNSELYGHAEDE